MINLISDGAIHNNYYLSNVNNILLCFIGMVYDLSEVYCLFYDPFYPIV